MIPGILLNQTLAPFLLRRNCVGLALFGPCRSRWAGKVFASRCRFLNILQRFGSHPANPKDATYLPVSSFDLLTLFAIVFVLTLHQAPVKATCVLGPGPFQPRTSWFLRASTAVFLPISPRSGNVSVRKPLSEPLCVLLRPPWGIKRPDVVSREKVFISWFPEPRNVSSDF